MTDDTDLTPEYIDSVCRAAPFADNDAGIPQMVELIRALSARLTEVEAQLKATLDREAATYARHDARAERAESICDRMKPAPAVAVEGLGPIAALLPDAVAAAEKAMLKFPQPNYVISKWAEETGEVTKALIHAAEGRETWENVRGEIVQSLAMLHRLMVEGDQVHGLPALRALAGESKP